MIAVAPLVEVKKTKSGDLFRQSACGAAIVRGEGGNSLARAALKMGLALGIRRHPRASAAPLHFPVFHFFPWASAGIITPLHFPEFHIFLIPFFLCFPAGMQILLCCSAVALGQLRAKRAVSIVS